MKKILLTLLIFAAFFVDAQIIRKYSNEFMNIGVDAAALGMSNAVETSNKKRNKLYFKAIYFLLYILFDYQTRNPAHAGFLSQRNEDKQRGISPFVISGVAHQCKTLVFTLVTKAKVYH